MANWGLSVKGNADKPSPCSATRLRVTPPEKAKKRTDSLKFEIPYPSVLCRFPSSTTAAAVLGSSAAGRSTRWGDLAGRGSAMGL